MNRKPRVYLAAPFFNKDQKFVVSGLEHVIPDCDYECYSPSRDGIILKPDASISDRRKVLSENIRGIDNADLIVAVMDGKDQGVLFEWGFAYASHKPIISFSSGDEKVNVMLGMTVIAHANSLETLHDYLIKFRTVLRHDTTAEDYANVVAELQHSSRVHTSPVF